MRDKHYCMIFDESGGHHAQTNPPHPLISYTFTVYPVYSIEYRLYSHYIGIIVLHWYTLMARVYWKRCKLDIKRQLRTLKLK
jgi:hypothetical protein